MQRRGELHVDSGGRLIARPDLGWDAVPPRVEAVIAERLASLPPAERSDLEVASVQGETFEPNIVAAVRAVSTTELAERLGRLAASPQPLIVGDISSFDRGIPTSVFRFRHALFQRVLYNALSAPTRRVLHASTARAMLAAQPDGDGRSVELARHFDEGGLGAEAADQYVRAGRRAMQMSATEQAIRLLGRALELIDADIAPTTTPTESDRHRQLAVLTALGSCLQARLGYTAPQTDVVYERIRALAVQEGPTFEAVQALGAVVTVDCLRARYERARAGTDALLDTASQLGLPLIEAVAHMQAGLVELVTGHPQVADQHCRSAFERYDPATDGWLTYVVGQDVGSTNLAWWSIAAWELGRLGEAGQLANRSVAAARATGHPFSVAFALSIAGCLVPFLRGEPRRALAAADEVARIADAEDFAFYRAAALVHGGLARAAAGEVGRGMRDLERGLAGWRELGTDAFACWIRTAQADLLVRAGHLDWAERLLVELRDALTDTGEDLALVRWWLAQGRLFAAQGEDARAEHALRHALEIGADRCQWGASLQVATALAALLRGSGSGEAADADLRLLLERITDGEDTIDVRTARALLT